MTSASEFGSPLSDSIPRLVKHVDEWLWAYFLSLHFGARGLHAMLRIAFRKAIACSQFGQNQTRSRWVVFNLGAQLADEDA